MSEQTQRSRLKAERRQQLLRAAARLFAERGFHAVSIEDLGAAVGVSGPAVYRHFASKEAILADLLVGVSHRLLDGGAAQAAAGGTPAEVLRRLVAYHTEFALTDRDLIRVQDRDLANLPAPAARVVRRRQRAYVDVWVEVLSRLDPSLPATVARTKAQATLGLLNSGLLNARPQRATSEDAETTRRILEEMAMAGLKSPGLAR